MLLNDLRHAARGLLRRPGFSVIAVLTLALGIGASSAIFSALYHTLLQPLPFTGGDRIVHAWMNGDGIMISPSTKVVDAWRERARSFDLITQYEQGEYTLRGGGEPEIVRGAAVEATLPAALGAPPLLGRTFTPEEMQPNARKVVMIGEGLWRRRFGGENVLGELLEVGDTRYEIVGVLPQRFGAISDRTGQLWFPLLPDTAGEGRGSTLLRMRAGVDTATANAELRTLSHGMESAHGFPGEWSPMLLPPTAFLEETTRKGLPLLFASVCGVLLIACANIAGLLLVRVSGRRREVAIRAAIGAGRGAITRLIGAEALLLALLGGGCGLLVAGWLMDLARLVRPESLTTLDTLHIDGITLGFLVLVTLLTALLFGTAPAWTAVRHDLLRPLTTGGAGGRVTSGGRLRAVLVSGQIAVSLVLLVASLLLLRSVAYLQDRDVGFAPEGVHALRLPLPDDQYATPEARVAFYETLLPALRRIPGVRDVATTTGVPTQFGAMFGGVEVLDRPLTDAERPPFLNYAEVSPDYVRTMGLQLVEGRFLEPGEADALIINDEWAQKLWPGQSAIGRRIRLSDDTAAQFMPVVGVVKSVSGWKGSTDVPQVYTPAKYSWGASWVVLRTEREVPGLARAVRNVIADLDARIVPRDFTTMTALLSDTIAQDRFFMLLLAFFASTAVLLSAIGLYGVIGTAVTQRVPEIGVRLALGATPRTVQRMILGQGLRLTTIGIAIGTVATYFLVKLLSSAIYGVSVRDPLTFAVAIALLATCALLAAWLPARRALRIDPVAALRAD